MKFGVQSSIGASFAQENFQQGRKGQKAKRSQGQKAKIPRTFYKQYGSNLKPASWFYINFQAKRTHFLKFCVRAHSEVSD